MLPPRTALAAAVCLDGLTYFQQSPAEFNNQVLLIAFWALAVVLFHHALTEDRWRDWIGLGAVLGLALLCKYSAVFLIAPLLGLGLWDNGLRRRGARVGVVALTAALIFLPHFVWLCQHDFPTLRYAVLRGQGESAAFNHRLSAATFLLSQGLRLLPVAVILLPLLTLRKRPVNAAGRRDRTFLATVVLGPVVLHLAASLLLGLELRDIWDALVDVCRALAPLARGDRRRRSSVAAHDGVVGGRGGIGDAAGAGGQPGRRPARQAASRPLFRRPARQGSDRRWQERFGAPPPIVAGDWWLAGNVCCHAPHRPTLYGSLEPAAFGLDLAKEKSDPRRFASPDPRTSPWTGDADLRQRGGVLLWDADCYGADMPEWLRDRFPAALRQAPLVLPCAGFGPEVRVGWAMIPPAEGGR